MEYYIYLLTLFLSLLKQKHVPKFTMIFFKIACCILIKIHQKKEYLELLHNWAKYLQMCNKKNYLKIWQKENNYFIVLQFPPIPTCLQKISAKKKLLHIIMKSLNIPAHSSLKCSIDYFISNSQFILCNKFHCSLTSYKAWKGIKGQLAHFGHHL